MKYNYIFALSLLIYSCLDGMNNVSPKSQDDLALLALSFSTNTKAPILSSSSRPKYKIIRQNNKRIIVPNDENQTTSLNFVQNMQNLTLATPATGSACSSSYASLNPSPNSSPVPSPLVRPQAPVPPSPTSPNTPFFTEQDLMDLEDLNMPALVTNSLTTPLITTEDLAALDSPEGW